MVQELIGGAPNERRLRNRDHAQLLHAIENIVVDVEVREVLDSMAVVGARIPFEGRFKRVEREILRARAVAVNPNLPSGGVGFEDLRSKLLAGSRQVAVIVGRPVVRLIGRRRRPPHTVEKNFDSANLEPVVSEPRSDTRADKRVQIEIA